MSSGRLVEVFGEPTSQPAISCTPPDNDILKSQVTTEFAGKFKFTLLKPAMRSLQAIVAEIEKSEPDLLTNAEAMGGLCARHARSSTNWSSHSFGTAADLWTDRSASFMSNDAKGMQKQEKLAGYFERAGWLWGGRFRTRDNVHFEVGANLFEKWLTSGDIKGKLAAKTP